MFIYDQLNDFTKSDSIKNILLIDYPTSEYASFINGGSFVKNDKQSALFKESEEALNYDNVKSIEKFKSTLKININSSLAAPAAFSIGYYYDQVSNADSAIKYYQFVVDNYPESEQSNFAVERLLNINQALSLIYADSTSPPELAPN